MEDEDPDALLTFIRGTYKLYELRAPDVKDYECDEVELFREMHAKFVMKGFERMPRGMTGLDSG